MTDEQLVQDPFTGYSRIRERAPLVRGFMPRVDPAWIVTRYHDVKLVLGDPRFVIDSANVPGMNLPSLHEQVTSSRIPPEYSKYVSSRMGELDGADHARLRNVAGASFSARRADEYRSRIKEICVELLDRLPDKAEDGVADLQAHFALPFAFNVLCELIGLPKDDFRRWRDWLEQIRRPDTWRDMVAYTRKLVEVRRQGESAADDDLISALIRARYGTGPDGGRISDTEMIAMIMHMGSSAYVTPAFMIGNGTVFLLTHPDQLALLRANPELTPQAVHELLRCCAPITLSPHLRYATEDVEIGGMVVKKGEAVWAAFRAANYDPRRFADPERFDITRQQEGRFEDHLSFSHGMHRCLGSHVARVELEVAFEALPHRFPNLTLAVAPENLRNERLPFQWGYAAVPVRL
jgi:cytochrome P450